MPAWLAHATEDQKARFRAAISTSSALCISTANALPPQRFETPVGTDYADALHAVLG